MKGYVDRRVMNAIEVAEQYADGIGDMRLAYGWCSDVEHRHNRMLGNLCLARVPLYSAYNITPLLPDKGKHLYDTMKPQKVVIRTTSDCIQLAELWYSGADCLKELYDELEYAGNVLKRVRVWKGWWVVDQILRKEGGGGEAAR